MLVHRTLRAKLSCRLALCHASTTASASRWAAERSYLEQALLRHLCPQWSTSAVAQKVARLVDEDGDALQLTSALQSHANLAMQQKGARMGNEKAGWLRYFQFIRVPPCTATHSPSVLPKRCCSTKP